ncbi:ABC transporter ATP-binding protein [Pigmentiphaga kullae]|uniref:Nucleoside ABC transporter ATP-binding protein n=1 Tax=Pigmentiphaga kullae TaxID=151784 RepID=A0A4Q7NAH0_9BURK|nr:ABC transporter ATP-binding protein [Pigmentiphaga kullae]RZS78901.1 nucleoside ABC transporter ATP-binding protein [Pigmentiphaga kullae]
MAVPRLELRGITKRYPGVLANDEVSLAIAPGEIHAVLGENGAGKSTLMKIAYGALAPDAGQILWDGRPVAPRAPDDARALGVGMVFQHFVLFDTLTVAQNVLLGLPAGLAREVSRGVAPSAWLAPLIERYRLDLDPDAFVGDLSVGEHQRVELLRALAGRPRLLILDEPTSVLSPEARTALFATLRQLAAEGCSVAYISHKLAEIRELCDRCTVLRAGRSVAVVDPREMAQDELATLMLGTSVDEVRSAVPRPAGDPVLSVRDLSMPAPPGQRVGLDDISFELRAGEILGVAGVSGNGQSLLLSALSGEEAHVPHEAVRLMGQPIGRLGPAARRRLGLRAIPEERLGRGCVPGMGLDENMLLTMACGPASSGGWIRRRGLAEAAARVIARHGVRAVSPRAPARSLSGGNLQKFMVGRELDGGPRVLLAAQPTWGVDIGAAARIHQELIDLREAGGAVLVISEDLDELLALCDRLAVMAGGRLSPAVARAQVTADMLGRWMEGRWAHDPA